MIYYCEVGTNGYKPLFGYKCPEHLQPGDHVLQELPQVPGFEPDECDICALEARDPGRIPATSAGAQREADQVPLPDPCMGCGELLPAAVMIPWQAEGGSGLICQECHQVHQEEPYSWRKAEADRVAALRAIADLPGPATREQLEAAGLPASHLPVIPTTCPHCGWDHPGPGTCEACLQFLATGIDPRPYCSRCGRTVPDGRVCPCNEPDDLLVELANAAGWLAERIRLITGELARE